MVAQAISHSCGDGFWDVFWVQTTEFADGLDVGIKVFGTNGRIFIFVCFICLRYTFFLANRIKASVESFCLRKRKKRRREGWEESCGLNFLCPYSLGETQIWLFGFQPPPQSVTPASTHTVSAPAEPRSLHDRRMTSSNGGQALTGF